MKQLTWQNQKTFFNGLTVGEQFEYDQNVFVLGDVIELALESGVEIEYVSGFICQVLCRPKSESREVD